MKRVIQFWVGARWFGEGFFLSSIQHRDRGLTQSHFAFSAARGKDRVNDRIRHRGQIEIKSKNKLSRGGFFAAGYLVLVPSPRYRMATGGKMAIRKYCDVPEANRVRSRSHPETQICHNRA